MDRYSVGRVIGRAIDVADPFQLASKLPFPDPPTTLISVYRRRNALNILRMLKQTGWPALLWALDEEHPLLPTVGSGPGSRFELLNRLSEGVASDQVLVVTDDDVWFRRGDLRGFARLANHFELDLAQPAHHRRKSHFHHPIVRRHFGRVGRLTTFVEIGPVLALAPCARAEFLPFPDEGMGWGVEFEWYDRYRDGRRLGIIDATPVRHLTPAATDYDPSGELDRLQRIFEERGVSGYADIQHTLADLRLTKPTHSGRS